MLPLKPFGPGHGPRFRRKQAYNTDPRVSSVNPPSSRTSGGISVTISGFNFRLNPDGSAPSVTFGGVAATAVVVVNSQTITCTVPAVDDPEVVDIVVTVNGQSGTGPGLFTYYESVITGLTPPYGPITGGTTVIIEGYNFLEGSLIYFDDLLATDIIFVDSQHFQCTTPAHGNAFVDVTIVEPL